MQFHLITLLASLSLAYAELHRCGTADPDDKTRTNLDKAYANYKSGQVTRRDGGIVIDTYVNIVTTQAKSELYTPKQVEDQMNAMNEAYAPMGVSFSTISVNFTINEQWAAAGISSPEELAMKSALHQGSYADLNLYFLSDMPSGLLGFCYFPVADPTSADRINDGCMNLADSLPGGSVENYDMGMTAVHETGHWFGLYHVFQGTRTCSPSSPGDSVSDTPLQRSPTTGCPTQSDTCPDQPGVDSIHNYMDYSYDECVYEFSEGQMERAVAVWEQYRSGE
ncbi:unnamed protein product [Zymoseptoria tritici ST99CH_3D7]|uniref:Peptidase M43 pregnancy-associated plasma-A domain-containing protein n=1 Tax=Zymoseptoria tritici (strain ST99CH_3D7) TaxID=1276538 RepID=A0A1X7S459_ZYMT9|nr:unnamed protein product [Zymoseptoria tritici ST99CH_3D7]